jgi:hypothetical protein
MPARGGNDRARRWAATGAEHDSSADPLLQAALAFEFDQRIAW